MPPVIPEDSGDQSSSGDASAVEKFLKQVIPFGNLAAVSDASSAEPTSSSVMLDTNSQNNYQPLQAADMPDMDKTFCKGMMMESNHPMMLGGGMSKGMVMYMDGFKFATSGNQPCLNLYFPSW